jgi:hypothetical protein
MKKITLLTILCMLFSWGSHAQFSCDTAVQLYDGFSELGITTPGNEGTEDWVTSADTGDGIYHYYFDDDVYLFSYTAQADEEISMTIFTRNAYNGIAIFSTCTGTSLAGYKNGSGSGFYSDFSQSVSAVLSEGETVYIAVGQWGSPYDLDFDVVSFSVAAIDQLPNCATSLTVPSTLTDVSIMSNISWPMVAGGVLGYRLSIGTQEGENDILDFHDVGNVTTYDPVNDFEFSSTYYITVIPYNALGNAEGCEPIMITTLDAPGPGNLCENSIVIDTFPYSTTDSTTNYSDEYYEGSPGANGCGSTSNYLNGNDVVYSFTPTTDSSYTVEMLTSGTYAGMFLYTSCSDIGQNCVAGATNDYLGGNLLLENFQVQADQTYYLVISTWANPQTVNYTLNITENTCTNLTASFEVVSDCEGGNAQFMVQTTISDMGSATSVSISDNQGSTPIIVTETGVVQFGPFPNGTSVVVTASNSDDVNCTRSSAALTQNICPPVNDRCAGAIAVTPGFDFASGAVVGTTVNASTTTGLTYDCQSNRSNDVWYTVEVPASGSITIETRRDGSSSLTDTVLSVFSGSCGSLIEIECIDDNEDDAFSTLNLEGLEEGEILYIGVWKYGTSDSSNGTFQISAYDESLRTCENHTVSYTVVDDCANNQFSVNVDVSNLGSATSLVVSDNQSTTPVDVTAIGIVSFGPYANGTSVIITATNVDDINCVKTSGSLVSTCPPVNDDCADAIVLTPGGDFASGSVVGSIISATTTEGLDFDCQTYRASDVWYTVAIPASGSITIETRGDGNSPLDDTVLSVFSGDCNALAEVGCNDDNDEGTFSTVYLEGLDEGEILYIGVWRWNGSDDGTFLVSAYDESLSTSDFNLESMSVYPNPVKDVLNISYSNTISNVELFNLLGQQVIENKLNTNEAAIDMSHLPAGTYLAKVTSNDKVQTIKVIKQ